MGMVSLFPLLIKRLGERKVKGRERERELEESCLCFVFDLKI
jgi:hypothetical protein